MKKLLLVLLMGFSILAIYAQHEQSNQEEQTNTDVYFGKQEVKLNALFLIAGAIDVGYEYILKEESSLGIHAMVAYDDSIRDNIQYFISPYYRYYFGEKYAAGFFLEGFGMLNSSERDLDLLFDDGEENYVTDFALGIGLGGKWITKSGFIGEIYVGYGRNLFKADESEYDLIGKGGISIGYRF
ncbi:hypothetical protein BWZ20_07615 [Winogradskyella sp. J14-2]|uniref:DUF3575 domain-containing protein n=1 Tax=Winogradskyella sp. J14-2 TaxID=1936080 RepID=UPI000972D772|nr:DUF3575 domain-containing protein [Winogradskyella sp. J14-2]APY08175.1 hypothetical protein BWZ20_07615 [Winogradskyella sp. J14-2]